MSITVLKFGGTSVSNVTNINKVADIIAEYKLKQNKIIVIVSAMSGSTNQLVSLCKDVCNNLATSEMLAEYDSVLATGENISASLLALALMTKNYQARSLQGWQIKFNTDSNFSKSLITSVGTSILEDLLDNNIIPVITGFQGVDSKGRITTLGRGGSDTSAVAIAAAIKADSCDIYTDVDGVYSADPRLVKNAKLLKIISFEEMVEIAGIGAKVLHPRSVEIAMRYNIPIRVISTFNKIAGTTIMSKYEMNETNKITAISFISDLNLITLKGCNSSYSELIGSIIEKNICIFQITSSADNHFSFLSQDLYNHALEAYFSEFSKNLFSDYSILKTMSCIGIVGAAISHDGFILSKVLKVLASNDIKIFAINNSEIRLNVIVNSEDVRRAIKLLHSELIEQNTI